MVNLPEKFLEEMKQLLDNDFDEYLSSFDKNPYRGISVNHLKSDENIIRELLPFDISKSPFNANSFYIPYECQGVGNHPLHHAGAYYVQEPSASSAVTLLDVQKGDRILDLCAAPGGKTAQIASELRGTGLIWSNEVVRNRAMVLLSNYERMGISNGVISSCDPGVIGRRLSGFFDKVLIDAPCSGEGMFRKNPDAVAEWSHEHMLACAQRQYSILDSACLAVKPGGTLVYSTCTFSYEENEGVIKRFLEHHEEFEPCDVDVGFGRKTDLSCAVRITPLEGGEGHFAARLKRKPDKEILYSKTEPISGKMSAAKVKKTMLRDNSAVLQREAEQVLGDIFLFVPNGDRRIIGEKLYIFPDGLPDIRDLGVIRAGVLAGEFKKNRFEPSHALFTCGRTKDFCRVLELKRNDDTIAEFLKGHEIECSTGNGYTAVSYEGMITGFGKCSGGRLKNKYPKGLRIV